MSKNQNRKRDRKEVSALLEEFQRSDLTREEFCAQHHLNVGTFQWWLHREKKKPFREYSHAPHFINIVPSRKKINHVAIISGPMDISDIANIIRGLFA